MKLLFTLFLCSTLYAAIPEEPLLEALETFGICARSPELVIEETQFKWLRRPDQELWQCEECKDLHPERTYAIFSNLGMTQGYTAQSQEYDYAIVLGTIKPEMEKRFKLLLSEWRRGVRFKTLVLLAGDRDLDPKLEGRNEKNETEMVKHLFSKLAIPEWRQMPVVIVDTPKKRDGSRPTTAGSFCTWLSMGPKVGRALVISGQPFIPRQDLIATRILPGFEVETIGNGFTLGEYMSQPNGLPILLDELARWIYEEWVRTCT